MGCDNQKAKPDAKGVARPYVGQEVELFVPKALNLPVVWEVQLQEWITQTGAQARWNEYASNEEASLAKMLQAPAPSGGRVVLFPLARLSEVDQFLAPLDTGHLADFDPKDILRGLRERIVSRDRSLVAIPVSAPVLVCYYRADLLRAAALNPPETWEDYQVLLESLQNWAPNSTAVEPLGPDHRDVTFFARSLAYAKHPENYSVWFDLDTGKPVIASPGFIQALEMAHRAWKRMPAAISNMSPVDCRREVLEGRAALAIGIEPVSNTAASGMTRPASIEIGVRPLPGSRRVFNRYSNRWDALPAGTIHAPGLCAFDGQAIGVNLQDPVAKGTAAWHLLSWLVNNQFETSWATLPKTPCRESQVSPAATWHETGLTVDEASQQADAVAQTLRNLQLSADLPIPPAAEFRHAAATWVGRILEQQELDSTAAIQQLQEAFEQIVAKIGVESISADYRRGLGLARKESQPAARTP